MNGPLERRGGAVWLDGRVVWMIDALGRATQGNISGVQRAMKAVRTGEDSECSNPSGERRRHDGHA
jgi:hypothetical protein